MTQRKRWLKTREFEKGECVAVRRPGKVDTDPETRNDHRLFGVLVWVYFVHERFESGFRDLTLCVKVLRGSGACVAPSTRDPVRIWHACVRLVCAWFQGSWCELRLTVVCLTSRCQKCLNQDNHSIFEWTAKVPRAERKDMVRVFRQVDRLDRTLLEKLDRGVRNLRHRRTMSSLVCQEVQVRKVLCSRQIS